MMVFRSKFDDAPLSVTHQHEHLYQALNTIQARIRVQDALLLVKMRLHRKK